jgi:uncharacterized membrane protein
MEHIERLPNETDEQYDIRVNKDIAAFSYVWIMSVAVFAMRRESKFAQYHSKQAIILFVASIVVWLVPFVGHFLIYLIVAGMLMGFINAAQGKYADVPVAGPLAKGEMSVSDLWHMSVPFLHRMVATIKRIFAKPDTPAAPASPAAATPTTSATATPSATTTETPQQAPASEPVQPPPATTAAPPTSPDPTSTEPPAPPPPL